VVGPTVDPAAASMPRQVARWLRVRGERDTIAPPQWFAAAATLMPHARTLVLPGAAHNAITTAGPQLAEAIDALLTAGRSPAHRRPLTCRARRPLTDPPAADRPAGR
jgi:hypothetical protein